MQTDLQPAPAPGPDLLRIVTAGSVDDGKSTLIGRLLHDTRSIMDDQWEAVARASRQRGDEGVNLALLTDGLRAEREQNITIDVAWRYFSTPRRRFVIADTPGHLQYTRNMVTGASTAELAIVLVDARRGVATQSRRHGFIASLLGIPHLVVAVNKMDRVGWDRAAFERIADEYREFAARLGVASLACIPLCALHGDNVVERGPRLPWYEGGTLLHHLETANPGGTRNRVDFRFPVQYVLRPHQDFRGFAGRVASGTVAPGDAVVVLPSGRESRVRAIETADGPLAQAVAGDSVVLTLDDEVDVARGDMLARPRNLPAVGSRLDATLCWMADAPLSADTPYLLMHTTRQVRAFVREVAYRIDVDTLHREPAATLGLNEIGRVSIATAQPLCFDPYDRNRATGAFILVDPWSNATVAAGMIRGEPRPAPAAAAERRSSPHVTAVEPALTRGEREARNGHRAAVLWLTGLSGAGKTTLAQALERRLVAAGCQAAVLDGDDLRHGLCGDLGFAAADRAENVRRAAEVARLFFERGQVVVCAFVSPFRDDRARARALFPAESFAEVHVRSPVELCRRRDVKGLYALAARGQVPGFTGVSAPYEPPAAAELTLDTAELGVEACVERLVALLAGMGAAGAAAG
ncbi:MAG: adenylyl-sulfate kinase [Longimicrobiaceae bacterium]